MNVVLDTNALMMPFEFKINIDLELTLLLGSPDIFVPSCVIGELCKLSMERKEAKAALQLSKKYSLINVNELGDRGVAEAGARLDGYVLTLDKNFIKILIQNGMKVITLKNNHLVIKND